MEGKKALPGAETPSRLGCYGSHTTGTTRTPLPPRSLRPSVGWPSSTSRVVRAERSPLFLIRCLLELATSAYNLAYVLWSVGQLAPAESLMRNPS